MIRQVATVSLCAGIAVALVLWKGVPALESGYANLDTWRDNVRTSPEGLATASLFKRAVANGAIGWNNKIGQIEMRRDTDLPRLDRLALFRIGEAGAVISAEIKRSYATSNYVAVRADFPNCEAPCEQRSTWTISKSGASASGQSLATGASAVRDASDLPPLPASHALLSRGVRPGYEPWHAFYAQRDFVLSGNVGDATELDVVGKLRGKPRGWSIKQTWCRNASGKLDACPDGGGRLPDAVRLERSPAAASDIVLSLSPIALVPPRPLAGVHRLTERIFLQCDGSVCTPVWQPNLSQRRYARRAPPLPELAGLPPDDAADPSRKAALRAFGDWVELRNGELRASAMATRTGARALIGGHPPLKGSLLAEVEDLPRRKKFQLTLHPEIQRIANDVVSELADRGSGAFANMYYSFPDDIPQISLVALDLKDAQRPGEIVAAAGTPEIRDGLSTWDLAALPYDNRSPVAPGPAAWTGTGWQHTPGSVWKILTALTVIDAIAGRTMTQQHSRELTKAIQGITAAEADRIFGEKTLSGLEGICAPHASGGALKGTDDPSCGAGFHSAIQDSGRGGPLRDHPSARYGLSEALGRSSNIWFVAAGLTVEARQRGATDGLSAMARTAGRLGLIEPAQLDADLGVGITMRDGAFIDADEGLTGTEQSQARAAATFGQRVKAGPLITAQLVASVALGKDVRPTLLSPAAIARSLYPSGEFAQISGLLLQEVREGMKSVVNTRAIPPENRPGTAFNAFEARAKSLKTYVRGKTGTAKRGVGLARISTFGGWLEDVNDTPTLAVGCSTTVLGQPEGDEIKVPQLCAHAVAEFFKRVELSGALQ